MRAKGNGMRQTLYYATAVAAALPGFEFDLWFGLLAPRKTPKPIVDTLSKEVTRILALPDIREKMQNQGAVAKASTPEQFDTFIKSEVVKLGMVVKASGARAD